VSDQKLIAELRDAVRQIDVLRAEIEKWKAYRVHDVEEKEWLRDQMIALRAVLWDYLHSYYTDTEWRVALADRARALLAEKP
jgi:uncharacterized protein (DUF608 family)